ncbi:glycosyltransferase [Kocuria rhizophila]|nr:glycosyltransferase [Kocuria rhizophila]
MSPPLETQLRRLEADSQIPVRVLRLAQNSGLARALHTALPQCAHDVVARADADNVASPGASSSSFP